jgi:hypothetical protein
MLAINAQQLIQRVDRDVTETDFEGNIVLLHIENGQYYNFNDSGSDLWRWLEQPKTLDELVALIQEKYAVEAENCRPDILVWLNDAKSKSLIEILAD